MHWNRKCDDPGCIIRRRVGHDEGRCPLHDHRPDRPGQRGRDLGHHLQKNEDEQVRKFFFERETATEGGIITSKMESVLFPNFENIKLEHFVPKCDRILAFSRSGIRLLDRFESIPDVE